MAVQLPTPSQLLDVAHEIGLDLTDDDVTSAEADDQLNAARLCFRTQRMA